MTAQGLQRQITRVPLLVPFAAVLIALCVGAGLIILVGMNPVSAYRALLEGAFGSRRALTEVALKATPLLIIALGLALAFQCRMWNIGAEGQLFMGALAGSWVGLTFGGWPAYLLVPVMIVAGSLAGAAWAAIPGVLKARQGVNEIVTSLMLNYVAIFFVSYLVRVPMKDPDYYLPQSASLAPAALLPKIPFTRLHTGVLIALLLVPIVYLILRRMPLGFSLRIVGSNPDVARFAGIRVSRSMVVAMVLSGALAGVAGVIEVAGVHERLMTGISSGYGYTAIVVALLGQLNAIGVLLAAYFFAALVIGADAMQRILGLPVALIQVIQALVLLFVLMSDAVTNQRA